MTIRLHDNQGRDWTVEGDWDGQVVGADFDGAGKILAWLTPKGGHLEPDTPAAEPIPIESRPVRSLPSGD